VKVVTKQQLAMSTIMATAALIAVAVWWADSNVGKATRSQIAATALARSLTELRLVTFEFVFKGERRALEQWHVVSDRLDNQLAALARTDIFGEKLAPMLLRRENVKYLWAQIVKTPEQDIRLRRLLTSQILVNQQANLASAYELTATATQRIQNAQLLSFTIGASGLAVICLIAIGFSVLLYHDITVPLRQLQRAARSTASGQLNTVFSVERDDELGALSHDLQAMATTLRTLLEEQRKASQKLQLLNQEMESFSYSVSHDLRGPLRSMDGFSLCLLEDYSDKLDADGVDALNRIRAASQRMGQLIDDLLALSQVTRAALNVSQVDVSALAREIAATIDHENAGTPVNWQIADGLTLQADRSAMAIALNNLMRNAWKFSGKAVQPVVHIDRCARGGKHWMRVADNGVGFDMAFADRLFGAFQRLHNVSEFPGTGIGLAIVKRVIARHGGEIVAESRPGHGAEFFFYTESVKP